MTREELLEAGKPILFNTEMTKAILNGRKTCTRRAIKLDLGLADTDKNDSSYLKIPNEYGDYHDAKDLCRYQAGDYLYVRETFQKLDSSLAMDLSAGEYAYVYRASENGKAWEENTENWRWKPSIHMPKEAARIFLKVTDVRVERLQDITKDYNNFNKEGIIEEHGFRSEMHRDFIDLWDSTVKKQDLDKYGWEANPFVWVIEFERVEVK